MQGTQDAGTQEQGPGALQKRAAVVGAIKILEGGVRGRVRAMGPGPEILLSGQAVDLLEGATVVQGARVTAFAVAIVPQVSRQPSSHTTDGLELTTFAAVSRSHIWRNSGQALLSYSWHTAENGPLNQESQRHDGNF